MNKETLNRNAYKILLSILTALFGVGKVGDYHNQVQGLDAVISIKNEISSFKTEIKTELTAVKDEMMRMNATVEGLLVRQTNQESNLSKLDDRIERRIEDINTRLIYIERKGNSK